MQHLDVPAVTVARYDAPVVTAAPVAKVISPTPVDSSPWGDLWPGHYQQIHLNTRTGTLVFFEVPKHRERWDPSWLCENDVPLATRQRWFPGTEFLSRGILQWSRSVPELLSWTIESGDAARPYLGPVAASAFLAELAPHAQVLLDGLFEACGELDWSARSASAGRIIGRLCTGDQPAILRSMIDADLADYGDVVAQFPKAFRPALLSAASPDDLTQRCQELAQFLHSTTEWYPELAWRRGDREAGFGMEILGVRAWYRTALAAQRPTLAWEEITVATTDAQLDDWVYRQILRSDDAGPLLAELTTAAYRHRAGLQARDRNRVDVVGARIGEVERELEALRAERAALVAEAITEGRSATDSA